LERRTDFQLARTNMVIQQVRPWQVLDNQVLTILSQIPRELFVPPAFTGIAYTDTAIPLSEGQVMLSPKLVGRALQALALTGEEKVLEVGTGTGYVTACLAKLVKTVVSIEIHAKLLAQAEKNLAMLGCRSLILKEGNAALGWAAQAPYDAIMITGSYPLGVPAQMKEQLKIKGRLFAICGQAPTMEAVLIERQTKTLYVTHTLFETVVPELIHAPQPSSFYF